MQRRLVAAVVLTALLAGCAGTEASDESSGSATTSTTTRSPDPTSSGDDATSASSSGSTGSTGLDPALASDLEDVAAAHPSADVAVAMSPVGGSTRPQVVGEETGLVAWSTIKVPLSLAVIDSGESHPDDITAALTISDNAAADRLWTSLGTGSEASSAVEEVLRSGGDRRTRVPSEVTSPGHSAFGQAVWRLSDQTAFTARLPCLAGSSDVTTAMGQVSGDQSWGFGQIEEARFKGGWGDTPGGYVVRQLGLLPGAKGETAATLQVRAGSHAEGTAIADELAGVLDEHGSDLPTGSCD